jgi:SAM-dependent methyltransferase
MPPDYSQFYAKFHPADPRHRHGLTLLHQRMLGPHLPADRSAPILDVGCGAGYALEDLRAMGYTNLRGIDLNPMLAAAAKAKGLDVTIVESTEAYLDAHAETYATILLMDVLEHVRREAQAGFLASLARRLRAGGRLICCVPNASSDIGSHWLYNDYTHQGSFTADSLSFLLEQAGFATVRCLGPEFFPRPRLLFWFPTKRTIAWWLRCVVRARQRITYIAELGWERGGRVVLTPNLLAVADKAG